MSNEKTTKYTNEDLKTMQRWPLERKILVSQTKILEFGLAYTDRTYISFSGGKDSTVLLDLVRRVFPDTPAVFIDTGLEYPEIKDFVQTVPNVMWLKPKMSFRQVIAKYGYPLVSKEVAQKIYEARSKPNGSVAQRFDDNSQAVIKYSGRYSMSKWKWLLDSSIPISHYCCVVMKKTPAKEYEKKHKRHPFLGMMACESDNRKTKWLQQGCNAFDDKRPNSNPLSFWTEQDILEYIKRFNLPYASVYGEILQDENGKYYTTGCQRTGCVFCAFGCHLEKEPSRFQLLKQTHPKLYDYCMKPRENGGLGLKSVFDWFNEHAPAGKRKTPHIYYK